MCLSILEAGRAPLLAYAAGQRTGLAIGDHLDPAATSALPCAQARQQDNRELQPLRLVDRQDAHGDLVRLGLGALDVAGLGPFESVDPVEEGPERVPPRRRELARTG